MPSFTLDHIALAVTDIDVSIAFYQKVFQLKEIQNTASDSKTKWLSLGEGKQLHLIPRPNADIKTHKAIHFALATSHFDAFVTHLETLNIDYSDWPGTTKKDYLRKDGIQQIYFQDSNGYWIEVNDGG